MAPRHSSVSPHREHFTGAGSGYCFPDEQVVQTIVRSLM